MNLLTMLAAAALALHLIWVLWVALGWLVTRRRPLLRWLHIASVAYGLFITLAPWPCPLTVAEQRLRQRAGLAPYEGSFLLHWLEALVYPDLPPALLTVGGVAACSLALGIHLNRFRRRDALDW